MTLETRYRQITGCTVLSVLLAAPAFAGKDSYETDADYRGLAVAIERPLPQFPPRRGRKSQEAWVQLSYVVTADGLAIDPVVINSSGDVYFETEVQKMTENWRFEKSATGNELPNNVASTRFTIRGKGKGTTRKFARHSRHIMYALHAENVALARKYADEALEAGGWNLYESTILWLMLGRIEGAEGDDIGQLEMYQRGLAVSDSRSLQNNARIDLLEKIFVLQSALGHFAGALATRDSLTKVPGSNEAMQRITIRADEVAGILANDEIIAAKATISTPCNCEAGTALWEFPQTRRTFSFANTNGNIERFEARCESQRISDNVELDKSWTLAPEWGFCHVLVFGDNGATFDFVEHLRADQGDTTGQQTAVANLLK